MSSDQVRDWWAEASDQEREQLARDVHKAADQAHGGAAPDYRLGRIMGLALLGLEALQSPESERLRRADLAITALCAHVSPEQQRRGGSREYIRAYRHALPPLPPVEIRDPEGLLAERLSPGDDQGEPTHIGEVLRDMGLTK